MAMVKKKGKLTYFRYFLKNVPFVLAYKLFKKAKSVEQFRFQKGITLDYTNEKLKEYISSGNPFIAYRFGGSELCCLNAHEKIALGLKKTYKPSVRYAMKNNAGYYPTDDDAELNKFGDVLLPRLKEMDLLGIMGLHMEDYFVREYCPQAVIVQNEGYEPLHGDWTKLLKGKKVLVISGFAKDIEAQYKKRELLFPDDPDILPEFELMTIEAPLTYADQEIPKETFFEAIERMNKQMDALDFDIALMGCGAYGAFLLLHAKELGKQAIYTGGSTPTLFGIIAKRWDKREHVAKHKNEHWIRPSIKPAGYEKIENGAYW